MDVEEKSQVLSKRLKLSIFGTFHSLLQMAAFPFWQAAVFMTIEFVQYLFFNFYPSAGFPWNFSSIEDVFSSVVKIFLVWPYLAERSLTLYFAFFYACGFLLVMSVSGMIILVATNMKKKSLVRITIVRFVGTLLFLFQTVLYLPIITMYILIASCDSNNFGLMISGLKCWNLEYQAHFSLGILFLVLEVIQVFPTTLLFYENTCSPANAFAKISPHAEVRSLAFKALLTVCALLFNESGNRIFLSYVILALGFLTVYEFRSKARFYDYRMTRLWNSYQEILLCVSMCNLLSILLESYDFAGGLILVLVFSLLILIYEYVFGSGSDYILAQSVSQAVLSDSFDLYTKELASLLNAKNIGRQQELYIRGYIGEHSRVCPCPNECPLGLAMRTNKSSLLKIDKSQHAFKSLPLLVAHAERLYEYYIENSHGKAAGANIAFARFIISFSKEPTLAIKYLNQARTLRPSLQEQFFAYRYERLLTESCKSHAYLEEAETINVLNVMKYEKYQSEFNEFVEQNGLLHMQFWSSLLDESPNMTKVCEVGFRILETNRALTKKWGKIQALIPGNPKDMILYANYLDQVWNDKEVSTQIQEKAKDSAYTNKYAMLMTTHLQDISNFSLDGSPCVFMSGKKQNMGEITNCNMAFCKIFGYTKKELVGRGIKTLMPKLIAEHHDKFIQRNLDCIKISCYKAVESDVFTFGLHQSKYMFPVSIKLLATPNILNDMHYIAKIKIDRKHTTNTICFLLLNKKKEVVDVTSSCMNMLNISYSTLTNYTVDMNVLAPSLLKKEVLQGCLQKSGGRLVVYHPSFEHRQKSDEAVFKDEVEGLAKGDEGTEFRCKLQELNYESAGKIGYSMMLESMQNSMVTSSTPAPRSVRFPSFQFTYREDLHIFVREMREDETSGNLMSSSLSHFMSTYSHDSGFSRSMLTCRRQDLSELSADKFKQLSMGTKMFSMMSAGGKHHHRSMAKSMYQSKFQRPMMGGSPDNKSTSGDHIVVDANNEPLLKKKNSFISVFSEISSKQNKSKHSSYYEALLPKYKHLSKFVMDDAGTRNLVKAIEGQVMYGEGVKTYRIYNGEFFEVVEETYSQLLAREIDTPQLNLGEGRRNIEKKKEEEYKMLRARIKTKNELAKLVNETPYPTSVSAIKPFTVVCIIILSVLLVLEYVYTRYRLQDILSATDTLSQSYSLKQVLLSLWYDSREMFLLSGSGYTAYLQDYSNSTVYIDHLRTKVDTNSYDANQLVDSLSGNGFSFPAVDDAFLNDASISMYLYTSGSDLSYVVTNYSIYQALLIEIESFRKIGKLNSTEFSSSGWLLNTAVDSLYSSLIPGLTRLHSIFLSLLSRLSVSSDTIDYLIIGFSAFDLFICLAVDWVLGKFIEKYEDKVMHIFLEMPRKYMIQLNAQCESFVGELQNTEGKNDLEESGDEDDAKAAAEASEKVSLQTNKGGYERIYTHKKMLGCTYIISYLVLMVLAEGYFVLQFVLRSQFYNKLNEFTTIYHKAYEDMVSLLQTVDVYREYYNNPSTTVGRIKLLRDSVFTEWESLYTAQKETENNVPSSSSLLGSASQNDILYLMNGNLCESAEMLAGMSSPSLCTSIGNKTATLGLNSLKVYATNTLKGMIYTYVEDSLNYLNDASMWEIKKMHDELIIPGDEKIIAILKQSLKDSYDTQLSDRIIYLVSFTFGLNLIFFILSYPFLQAMSNFVHFSRSMLTIVPVEGLILCKGFDKLVLRRLKK